MSRPVARNTGNQFDDLPSPHTRSPNKSRNSKASAGPSRLSQRFIPSDDDPVSANTRRATGYEDMSLDSGFHNDLSPQYRSFSEMDQDGIEEDQPTDIEDEPSTAPPKRKKGRKSIVERPATPEEQPPRTLTPDVEDDIQRQLEDVDEDLEAERVEQEEEEEEPPAPAKKAKLDKGKEKAKPRGQAKKKENHREGVPVSSLNLDIFLSYLQVYAVVSANPLNLSSGGGTRNTCTKNLHKAASWYLTSKRFFGYLRNQRNLWESISQSGNAGEAQAKPPSPPQTLKKDGTLIHLL